MSLNEKQKRFVSEYAKDFNGTQAAIRAGYSPQTAGAQAYDLLKKPEIKAEISKLGKEAEFDAARILKEIGRLALVDIGQAFTKEGALKDLADMPEDVRRCISAIEYEDLFEGRGEDRQKVGDLVKVKFWDKTKALEMAGKFLKLFTEKHEHTGKDGAPLTVEVVRYK